MRLVKHFRGDLLPDSARRPLPPVWLEEGSMSNADEYRQFANDCIVWARIATSDDQRERFLDSPKCG